MSAVTALNADGCTALMLAAREGHIDCLAALLAHHASTQLAAGCTAPACSKRTPELPHTAGTTALMFAATKGFQECVHLLLQHGSQAEATAADAAGWTALMWAAWGGHAGCIGVLLEGTERVISQQVTAVSTHFVTLWDNCFGYAAKTNALMLAATKGHTSCVQLLLEHSPAAQVTAADRFKQNALVLAAGQGHVECMRQLLAHSPEVQLAAGYRDRRGYTPIMIAIEPLRPDCIALLLEVAAEAQLLSVTHGGSLGAYFGHQAGMTALILVVTRWSDVEAGLACMRLLLAHCPAAQVAAADADGWTALMWAAAGGCSEFVALLLTHSPSAQVAAVSSREKSGGNGPLANAGIAGFAAGYSALRIAVRQGHVECVRLLLLHHSPELQVPAMTPTGGTALMTAAVYDQVHCLALLLAHSSAATQVLAVDGSGHSALSLAASHGCVDCLMQMLQHIPCGSHLDASLVKAACSMAEAELAAPGGAGAGAEDFSGARRRRCLELMIARGAKHPVDAQAAAVVGPIVQDLARRALVPGMVNEAVVSLAIAATAKTGGGQRMKGLKDVWQ